MKKMTAHSGAAAFACGLAVLAACGSDSTAIGPGSEDGGSSSGSSGSSSGSSGSSGGSSGDAATEASVDGSSSGETACDPSAMGCAANEVCTALGRPAGVCRATCMQESDCAAPATSCVFLDGGGGACVATCAPFGTDCPAGFTCTAHASDPAIAPGQAQTSHAAFCRKTGGTAAGASCVDDPSSCGANEDCHFFPDRGEGVPQSTCHALCDAAHACAAGT